MKNVLVKWLFRLLFLLILLYVAFILIAPPIVIKQKNGVWSSSPYQSSERANSIVQSHPFIADLHCDALLWRRNLTKRSSIGHVDFPRMQEGNIALQNFTIVTKSPKGQNFKENSEDAFDNITPLSIGQGQPISTWFSLLNRCLYQCKKLKRAIQRYENQAILVTNQSSLKALINRRVNDKNIIGGMLGVEGGHCLEGDLNNLTLIYNAGVRMLGPTHFFDNDIGGSAHGVSRSGLTPFGRQIIQQMQRLNMIVDVAHSSDKVIEEILDNYEGPVVSSHTGVRALTPSNRNLSDEQIKGIASKGGLIGIAFFEGAISPLSIPNIVKSMIYVRDLVGINHVALGSDYDGSVTTPFDITGLNLLVDEMLNQKMTEREINAILGNNVKRLLLQHLPADD